MIKKGDKLECIDDSHMTRYVKTGTIYEALDDEKPCRITSKMEIEIMTNAGHKSSLYSYRFKVISPIVQPPMTSTVTLTASGTLRNSTGLKLGDKIKCVNNDGWENELTQGKMYDVNHIPKDNDEIGITNDNGKNVYPYTSRFVLVGYNSVKEITDMLVDLGNVDPRMCSCKPNTFKHRYSYVMIMGKKVDYRVCNQCNKEVK